MQDPILTDEEILERKIAELEKSSPAPPPTTPVPSAPAGPTPGSWENFVRAYQSPGLSNSPSADLAKLATQFGTGFGAGGPYGGIASMVPVMIDPQKTLRPGIGAGNVTEALLSGVTKGASKLVPEMGNAAKTLMEMFTGGANGYAQARDFGASDQDKTTSGGVGTLLGALPGGVRSLHSVFKGIPTYVSNEVGKAATKMANITPDTADIQRKLFDLFQGLSRSPKLEEVMTGAAGKQALGTETRSVADKLATGRLPFVKAATTKADKAQAMVEMLPRSLTPLTKASAPETKAWIAAELSKSKQARNMTGLQSTANAGQKTAITSNVAFKQAETAYQDLWKAAKIEPAAVSTRSRAFLSSLPKGQDTLTGSIKHALKDPDHAEGMIDLLHLAGPEHAAAARAQVLTDLFENVRNGKGTFTGAGLETKLNSANAEAFGKFFEDESILGTLKQMTEKIKSAEEFAKMKGLSWGHISVPAATAATYHVSGSNATTASSAALLIAGVGVAKFIINLPHFVEGLAANPKTGKMVMSYLNSTTPEKLPKAVIDAAQKYLIPASFTPK